jgi:predicted amidophosphoribosyltransferase
MLFNAIIGQNSLAIYNKGLNVTYGPKICPRCKENNSNTTHYCYKCEIPLDEVTLQEFVENQRRARRLNLKREI